MISGNGVTDKGQSFAPHELQEVERIKNGQLAPVGLPPPLQVPIIGPPELHAILMLLNPPTRVIRVIRRLRVGNPLSGEDIAAADALRRPDTPRFGLGRAPAQICPDFLACPLVWRVKIDFDIWGSVEGVEKWEDSEEDDGEGEWEDYFGSFLNCGFLCRGEIHGEEDEGRVYSGIV
nr:hypothetical protein Iba_chr02fCG2190 [Ipomoea batatas]